MILAMDEGQYDGKVDVWSLGITCIELGKDVILFSLHSFLFHLLSPSHPSSKASKLLSILILPFIQLRLLSNLARF